MKHKWLRDSLITIGAFSMLFQFTGCNFSPEDSNNSDSKTPESEYEFDDSTVKKDYYDVWDGSIATSFKEGNGSNKNPYQISTGAELAYFASLINDGNKDFNSAHYCLVNSIDLNGMEWTPIGLFQEDWRGTMPNNKYRSFYGEFDGKSCVVKNYKITKSNSEELGFFADLNGGVIKNLGVIGDLSASSSTTTTYLVGGLVGWNRSGTIENCFVSGDTSFTTTTGDCKVGGIVAHNSGTIHNCFVIGDIRANYRAKSMFGRENKKSTLAGGIVALNDGDIKNTFVKGNISAFSSNESATAGGIVGNNSGEGKICNAYIRGSVRVESYNQSDIKSASTNCYAGGLVGTLYGSIESCYSIANVQACATSQINVGKSFGVYASSAKSSDIFYDAERDVSYGFFLYSNDAEKKLCEKGSGVTENIIKTAGFIESLNWDINDWLVNNGEDPCLKNLPNSFIVYFQGISKQKIVLDLEGYRTLFNYEIGVYEKEGYEFIGWMDEETQSVLSNSEGIYNSKDDITSDMVLVPKLSVVTYVAEFYVDEVLVDTVEFTIEDDSIIEPDVPEKAGYTGCWESYSLKAENLIIRAQYIPLE